ncbi:MAG: 3-isopropylmalate dehydrogenase, partial [bacterium]|nr:3-isopropylmalate dehydrogenase [bacterium]
IANPIGTIASAALLLRHSLGATATAARIERAIDRALADGLRSADLGGTLGTDELTRGVVERL